MPTARLASEGDAELNGVVFTSIPCCLTSTTKEADLLVAAQTCLKSQLWSSIRSDQTALAGTRQIVVTSDQKRPPGVDRQSLLVSSGLGCGLGNSSVS